MLYMKAQNIAYSIGTRKLLDIKELTVHEGERIGLVGKNGQGKTLLIRYLMGELDVVPQIEWHASYGWLKQLNEAGKAEGKSGGEQTLAKLDDLFKRKNKLLFLDEPTNNLDWEHIEKLEERLRSHHGALVVVSHDRMLLDQVCDKIWELEEGHLKEYNGSYSFYEELKVLEREQQYQEHEKYTKEKRRIEDRIRQKLTQSKGMRKPPKRMGSSEWQLGKNKAAGKQKKVERVSKTLERRLDRLQKVEKPFEWDEVKMEFDHFTPYRGRFLVQLKDFEVKLSTHRLFHVNHLSLLTGKKTALIGRNGAGKSTFINELLDRKNDLFPNGVSIGYFNQKLEEMPEEVTVLEYAKQESLLQESKVRIVLARLRFFEDDMNKRIAALSGGERVKLALGRLLVSEHQLLILDEPTNHLDAEAIYALEQLINEYPGSLLYVTHDRTFISRTADHLWMIQDKKIKSFDGTWAEWEENRQKSGTVNENNYDRMALETRMTELISRLSLPQPSDDKDALEEEYQEILKKLQELKK
ncbi:ribosomal protection-like ABC-F family protein [Halobacillus mangrovi]|uniref:ribosomal protection-like ABC-F family protein n=1 Tax=Halobacillus mangrovi TaxID=402384 RepID=UPI003D9717C3